MIDSKIKYNSQAAEALCAVSVVSRSQTRFLNPAGWLRETNASARSKSSDRGLGRAGQLHACTRLIREQGRLELLVSVVKIDEDR